MNVKCPLAINLTLMPGKLSPASSVQPCHFLSYRKVFQQPGDCVKSAPYSRWNLTIFQALVLWASQEPRFTSAVLLRSHTFGSIQSISLTVSRILLDSAGIAALFCILPYFSQPQLKTRLTANHSLLPLCHRAPCQIVDTRVGTVLKYNH